MTVLLDISVPVSSRSAHFPGDEPFSCGWTMTMAAGGSCNVGAVRTSPHVGTHVDAPYHYDEAGPRVAGLDIDAFVGPCVVVDARCASSLDARVLRGVDLRASPRVLFRTAKRVDAETFRSDFPLLTEEAVAMLAASGVRLVGIDAPSYDATDAKELRVHRALGRAGIANVENLDLSRAEPGRFELLAQPVRWDEMDAAPLRALLRR